MSDDRIQPEQPERPDSARRPRKPSENQPGDEDGLQRERPARPENARRLRKAVDDNYDDDDDDDGDLPKLGSLAQAARHKHLKQARNTLLTVGVLIIIFQTVFFFVEMGKIQEEVRKVGPPGNPADAANLKNWEATNQAFLILFHGSAVTLGIIFVVLAFLVEAYPVPTTAVALGLFLTLQIAFMVANPLNIVSGWWIKIVVVVALVKALQAGIAAQNERRTLAED
jgi:hypothetical protein